MYVVRGLDERFGQFAEEPLFPGVVIIATSGESRRETDGRNPALGRGTALRVVQ